MDKTHGYWKDVFKIANKPATSEQKRNRTTILKNSLTNPNADGNEKISYWGYYVFDVGEFALEL